MRMTLDYDMITCLNIYMKIKEIFKIIKKKIISVLFQKIFIENNHTIVILILHLVDPPKPQESVATWTVQKALGPIY